MALSKLIEEKCIYAGVHAASVKSLRNAIGDGMHHRLGLAKPAVAQIVANADAWKDAYMQDGLAVVPLPCETASTKLLFFLLSKPLDMKAGDHIPIDMVVVLCYPAQEAATRLQTMATVSRRLRNQDLRKQLRGVQDASAAYVLLMRNDQDQAA
ncbi:hypothetical protein GC177_09155 [bacterium]|nr:hypothetical protein [bacterium]